MKWLVYVLILVNLGIFVWHYQGLESEPKTRVLDQSTRLVLLREYQVRQQSEKVENVKNGVSQCYSLGPFSKNKSASDAMAAFEKAKVKIWKRVDRDAIRNGYWVYLPPVASRQQANAAMENLKQLKIKDFFRVATGDMTNAVSLGVFSRSNLAKARMQAINQQGFQAKVKKITLPKRVYWLDWGKQAKHQPGDELIDSMRTQFKGIGQTERACQPE